jgi:hypothetical protein
MQFFSSLPAMPIVAAILYPALWWLVAAKGRWTLGCLLGLLIGIAIPWVSSGIAIPLVRLGISEHFTSTHLHPQPQKTDLSIRRLTSSSNAKGMVEDQASVSRFLEIGGLGPDEFIGGIRILRLRNREEMPALGDGESDRYLGDMEGTAFSTDADGLLIPATASLFHAMGWVKTAESRFPVWSAKSSEVSEVELASWFSLPLRYPNRRRPAETFESAERVWAMEGAIYRWEKVLDTTAKRGGRTRLPGGGVVEMFPVDPSLPVFEVVVRRIRGFSQFEPDFPRLHPVLVARGESGLPRFVAPDLPFSNRPLTLGFLLKEREFQFRAPLASSPTNRQTKAVENMRLELYWPVFRGSFEATLQPP